jgi:hypothetical protein
MKSPEIWPAPSDRLAPIAGLVLIGLGLGVPLAINAWLNEGHRDYPFETPMLAEEALPQGSAVIPGSCRHWGKRQEMFGCEFNLVTSAHDREAFFGLEMPKRGWRFIPRGEIPRQFPHWFERAEHSHISTLCRKGESLTVFWPTAALNPITVIRQRGDLCRVMSNNASERTGEHRGPRLAAQSSSPVAQLDR